MADPVTLVILVAAGEVASPGTTAMAQGARDAFSGAAAEVRETRGAPTDADATAVEDASHPDAVAEVLWRDADHRRATLRVHLRRSSRWIERSFTFGASDPAAERGRSLGFAVAAILPEAASATRAAAVAAAPTATASTPATAGSGSAATPPAGASATGAATASVSPPTSTPNATQGATPSSTPATTPGGAPAPAPTPVTAKTPGSSAPSATTDTTETSREVSRLPLIGVDVLGAIAPGLGNPTTEGGGGAIEWFLHPRFSLRIGALARWGNIDIAAARTTTIATSAGIVLRPWQATRAEPFAVAIRVDYILLWESATHIDGDDTSPVTMGAWLSGVDTFFDGQLLLSSQIAAVAGVGVEDVWSPTYISVRDRQVATLPALRMVAEAGFQLRF